MQPNIGINKVILVGHIHNNTDLKLHKSGERFVQFQFKTLEKISKNPKDVYHQEYHKVKIPAHLLFDERKLFSEGQMIWLEGKIQTRKDVGADGIRRYVTEIMVTKYNLID
jgi:single-strand DNA-binding protein